MARNADKCREIKVKSESNIYVMTRLLKDRLCIKMTFMHNGCWVDYYEKCSRH